MYSALQFSGDTDANKFEITSIRDITENTIKFQTSVIPTKAIDKYAVSNLFLLFNFLSRWQTIKNGMNEKGNVTKKLHFLVFYKADLKSHD